MLMYCNALLGTEIHLSVPPKNNFGKQNGTPGLHYGKACTCVDTVLVVRCDVDPCVGICAGPVYMQQLIHLAPPFLLFAGIHDYQYHGKYHCTHHICDQKAAWVNLIIAGCAVRTFVCICSF